MSGPGGRARRLRAALVRRSGLALLLREMRQRTRVTIGFYHDIAPDDLDHQLRVLGARYSFVTLAQCVDAIEAGSFAKLPPMPLVITLDDGLASQRPLLEVFQRHGVRPTIFLCSGMIGTNRRLWTSALDDRAEIERLKSLPDEERVAALAAAGIDEAGEAGERTMLSLQEIEEMRPHVDFQAHAVLHPILPRCTEERAKREITESRKNLAEQLGLDVFAFCYPNGSFGAREVAYVRAAGYRCAVSTDPGTNGLATDPFRLLRVSLPEHPTTTDDIVVTACAPLGEVKRALTGG